jgi:hypothetical protein
MTATVQVLSDDSLAKLKRDHDRLRYEVQELRVMLRSYLSELIDDGPMLRGGCLAEDHPGRGIAFDLYLGVWSRANDKWEYDTSKTVKAIDWRYGVPYPPAGSTGLFERRPSTTYGVIWEDVSLDCESPGDCGD